MSLPQNADGTPKPLNLKLPPDLEHWRLGDIALFEPGGFNVTGFITFLVKYSNWTKAEIDNLLAFEMQDVLGGVKKQIELTAVPKANAGSS